MYMSAQHLYHNMDKDTWNNLVKENEQLDIEAVDIDDSLCTFRQIIMTKSLLHTVNEHTFILGSVEYPNGICLLILDKENIDRLCGEITKESISLTRCNPEMSWYNTGTKVAIISCANRKDRDSSSIEYDLVVPFSCSLIEWNDNYLNQLSLGPTHELEHIDPLHCVRLKKAYLMIVSRSKRKRSH